MGNQLAPPSKTGVEHSAELLNVVFKETLGEVAAAWEQQGHAYTPCPHALLTCAHLHAWCCLAGPGRLLKSLLCLHDNGGLVVVKVSSRGLKPMSWCCKSRGQSCCSGWLGPLTTNHGPAGCCCLQVFDKRKDISSLTAYKQQLEAIR
jgi:hypothetical protein